MEYIKVVFVAGQDAIDMLVALLADAGYDGFEESGDGLFAYIERAKFDKGELAAIAAGQGVTYETEVIPAQNWNALWESNFQPVVVEDFCTIRAHFHSMEVTTPYDIIITPKMSFGTGHHATTQLMILMMRETGFSGRTVLDFGTGTGVLAILAEMLGADRIIAIDNDEWCVQNALENSSRNNCTKIHVLKGSVEDDPTDMVDVILANINRHILLQYMPVLYRRLNHGGTILMSGLLLDDEDIIVACAIENGFHFKTLKERSGWIVLCFNKI